jgi:hypothetical protein
MGQRRTAFIINLPKPNAIRIRLKPGFLVGASRLDFRGTAHDHDAATIQKIRARSDEG